MERVKAAFITSIAVTAIFVTSLWIPTIDNLCNFAPSITGNEKSMLSQLPEFKLDRKSIIDFHNKFVKYFIDNFGFRNTLIRWNSLVKLNFLKVAQFPKVLVGKDEWLYLIKDDEGNNALDYFRAVKPFATEKEVADWVQPLVDIKKYCGRRGIRFLLVFCPMKPRIYPEYVPRYLEPVRKTTRLDQILVYLDKHSNIDSIDLGGALLEAKKQHVVFLKHDVHWNAVGAFYGYRRIAKELAQFYPRLKPHLITDYNLVPETIHGGDLASMLGLKDRFSETIYLLNPKYTPHASKVPILYPVKGSRFTEVFENTDRSLPRAIVYHDSFFNFVKPFIAEHFSRMVCLQSYNRVDLSLLDVEKPDIVIYEMAESFAQKSPAYVTPMNY
jgi:alginate O-acetyltransferase complex protein AlgJ